MQPRSNSDEDKLARLHKHASETASLIREKASDDTILLTSHFDADGISAGSIMLGAVNRLESFPHLRIIDSVNERILDQIEAIESDLVIFTDIGSGYLEIISKILRNRDIVIADHHQPLGEPGSNLHHFNTHILGFDGSEEISGAGTAYLLAKALDSRNTDLSAMAIVGALGDQQDKGPERRFRGLNADILRDAVDSKVIEVTKDLIFFGRQTRPIHRAIASTTDPFLPGLSGEEDRCLALLDAAGIHTISSTFPGEIVLNLIGSVYTLTREEPGTSLRDAREFATLLNSCGRMNRAGLGVAIGIGDRRESYQQAQQLYSEYKTQLSKYMNWVATAQNATRTGRNVVIVNGKGIIDESMTGAVSSLISSSKLFGESKVTVVTTLTRSGEAKVSTRATEQLVQKAVNLGKILQDLSPKYGGIGGGHAIAAGATIPAGVLDKFLADLEKSIDDVLA